MGLNYSHFNGGFSFVSIFVLVYGVIVSHDLRFQLSVNRTFLNSPIISNHMGFRDAIDTWNVGGNICLHFVICVKKDTAGQLKIYMDMPGKTREYMWIIIHCWWVIGYDNHLHWQTSFLYSLFRWLLQFLLAKPWIPGGDKSIFMAVFH